MRERPLVVDASLNRRIVAELKGRGRPAVGVGELGLARAPDAELLEGLVRRYRGAEWVLMTADDSLPGEQHHLVAELGLTLATIEWRSSGPQAVREQAAREICHRWAHAMAAQRAGTARRYSPERHRLWTSRTR